MSALWEILKSVLWLVVRFFKRKDANEPQQRIDDARNAAATGDDAALNADLDAARDRLRDPTRGTGNSQ